MEDYATNVPYILLNGVYMMGYDGLKCLQETIKEIKAYNFVFDKNGKASVDEDA